MCKIKTQLQQTFDVPLWAKNMWIKLLQVSDCTSASNASASFKDQKQRHARFWKVIWNKKLYTRDRYNLPEPSTGTRHYSCFNNINANQRMLEIGSLFSSLSTCEFQNLSSFPKWFYFFSLVKTGNPWSSTVQNIQGPLTCSVHQLIRWYQTIYKPWTKSILPFHWLGSLNLKKERGKN